MDFGNPYGLQGGMRIIAKAGDGVKQGDAEYTGRRNTGKMRHSKNISDALAHSTLRLLHPVLFVQKQNATTDANILHTITSIVIRGKTSLHHLRPYRSHGSDISTAAPQEFLYCLSII